MEKALEDSLWEIKKKYQEILEDLKKDEVLSKAIGGCISPLSWGKANEPWQQLYKVV